MQRTWWPEAGTIIVTGPYCWSLRCSWSITCRSCSNYIFILDITPGFNRLHKDNCKARGETFKFWDLVHLILETWQYIHSSNSLCIYEASSQAFCSCPTTHKNTMDIWFIILMVLCKTFNSSAHWYHHSLTLCHQFVNSLKNNHLLYLLVNFSNVNSPAVNELELI